VIFEGKTSKSGRLFIVEHGCDVDIHERIPASQVPAKRYCIARFEDGHAGASTRIVPASNQLDVWTYVCALKFKCSLNITYS
jgi:hypothetical protein